MRTNKLWIHQETANVIVRASALRKNDKSKHCLRTLESHYRTPLLAKLNGPELQGEPDRRAQFDT